jgi:hypothetical protein
MKVSGRAQEMDSEPQCAVQVRKCTGRTRCVPYYGLGLAARLKVFTICITLLGVGYIA